MARNLTIEERRNLESQLASARSIADVMAIARVTPRQAARVVAIACGYRVSRPSVEFTDSDLAWFRAPIKEGK